MLYNVAQLLKESVGATRRYEVSEPAEYPEEGWGEVMPRGTVSLLRTPQGVLVQAQMEVSIPEECGRCLEPFSQQVVAEIEEVFQPITDVNTGAPLALPRDEDVFTIDERHMLDLTEALRQGILVALPIQPLCRPDCAGLCPNCGKNLNEGPCDCAQAPIDPRWAALEEIRSNYGRAS
jgi:DUF177 domain-containing protein